MKRLAMLILAASITAVPAVAANSASSATGLKAAFRNTILSTYPDGRQAKLWLSADRSYMAEGRRHDRSDGRWKVKGDQLCLKQKHPWEPPFSYCTDLHTGGVGTSWHAKAPTGEPINIMLIKGRPAGVSANNQQASQ